MRHSSKPRSSTRQRSPAASTPPGSSLLQGAGRVLGFGDDELAARYFEKALAVDPDNIDNNFFYGEFLLDRGDYGRARAVLEHALAAPTVADRPVFDAGRRQEIRAVLAVVERKIAS